MGCPATPNAGRPTSSAADDREQAIVDELAQRLGAEADERTRDWWNRYLKNTIEFRGVPMAGVRKIARALWHEHDLAQWTRDRRVDLALTFLAQPYAEEKLAGILLLAERLLPELRAGDVSVLAKPFERGHIAEWSTCDWYCVKVLARLLGRVDDRRAAAEEIAAWRHAESLWQRRAAAVSFVELAARGARADPWLPDLVLEVCAANARDPARFSQTSVGWVLRELSKAEPERVASFVEQHQDLLSREARYMATDRLDPKVRRRFNPSGARR